MDDPAVLTLAALEAQGVGAGRLATLRDAFGTVAAALEAASKAAPAPAGFPSGVFRRLPHALDLAGAARRVGTLRAAGIDPVCWDDPRYPSPLWMDDTAPPALLYVQGSIPAALAAPAYRVRAAAVVGTRRPTARGVGLARELASSLAGLGVVVVSGLALGIDGAAHEGALVGGAPTVAVLGGGHHYLHPPSHRGLAQRILDRGGAILSEHPPEVRPERHQFPERNRLISGLSRLIVVVEAGLRSGARSTADHALRQKRDVFACPGRPGDPTVAGTLRLIRDGALLVTELEDVLFRFRSGKEAAAAGEPTSAFPDRASAAPVLDALYAVEEVTLDELAASLDAPFGGLAGRLTSLEIDGRVVRTATGGYRLATRERERRNARILREEAEGLADEGAAPGDGETEARGGLG